MFTKLSEYNKTSIIKDKTAVEGGYVNNKKDSGGETNHGITVGLATQYRHKLIEKFQWNGNMRDLSKNAAYWLYEVHFWNRIYGDDLFARHPLIADKLFDMSINMGATTACRYFQEILNANNNQGTLYADLVADGYIGPKTLKALDAYLGRRGKEGIHRALIALLCEQGHHYLSLVQRRQKDEEFYYGWSGRVSRDVALYVNVLGL